LGKYIFPINEFVRELFSHYWEKPFRPESSFAGIDKSRERNNNRVNLQKTVFFHSVSERVAADAEHASRLDLIAFGRIQGLLNQAFF